MTATIGGSAVLRRDITTPTDVGSLARHVGGTTHVVAGSQVILAMPMKTAPIGMLSNSQAIMTPTVAGLLDGLMAIMTPAVAGYQRVRAITRTTTIARTTNIVRVLVSMT